MGTSLWTPVSTRNIRVLAGVAFLLLALSGVVTFNWWQAVLSGLSTDQIVEPRTRLILKVAILSLFAPGVLFIFWPAYRNWLIIIQQYLGRMSVGAFLSSVLVVAAMLRITVVLALPVRLILDYRTYHVLAGLWAMTGEYTNGQSPTAYFPPGWPFLLSRLYLIFGQQPLAGLIANIVLGTATVYLGYRLIYRAWGKLPARWAAIILAAFPSHVLFVNFLCSEVLFTFLLLLALNILLAQPAGRVKALSWVFISGLFLGLASLVRSLTLMFPIIVIPFIGGRSLSKKSAALRWVVLVTGLTVMVAPWMARNHHRMGRATISTNGGVNFYIGNNPQAGGGFNLPDSNFFIMGPGADEVYYDSLGYRMATEHIRRYPIAFLKRGVLKIIHLMASDIEGLVYELKAAAESGKSTAAVWIAVSMQSYYLLCLLFAVIGVVMFFRQRLFRNTGGWLLLLTIIYWLAVHFWVFGDARFHFPIIPILSGFAGIGITTVIQSAQMQIPPRRLRNETQAFKARALRPR